MAGACPNCGHENGARAKFCSECGASLAVSETRGAQGRHDPVQRRHRLDEPRRAARSGVAARRDGPRFDDIARAVVARHGGKVEKFIGDALMAVFGVPDVHEDDALRAVRAALDLGASSGELNDELEAAYGVRLAIRTGINTGEVAVGAGGGVRERRRRQRRGSTRAVAAPGEILISAIDLRARSRCGRGRGAGPLELKGKAAAVEAWRLRRR